MRCLFKDNLPLAEFVLRILTDKPDLMVTEFETQKDMKRLVGARSICLDVYATDKAGKKYDLEIQRADKGADPLRARYHSSAMDVENLNVGEPFNSLPETYTIFITEKDIFGRGQPIYFIERRFRDTGKIFPDKSNILYVNGEYRDSSDIGKLMHDFSCTNAKDMYFDLMAERTRCLKENPKGVREMCQVIEEMRAEERREGWQAGWKQGRQEKMREVVLRMIAAETLSSEEIAQYSGLSLEEVKELQAEEQSKLQA